MVKNFSQSDCKEQKKDELGMEKDISLEVGPASEERPASIENFKIQVNTLEQKLTEREGEIELLRMDLEDKKMYIRKIRKNAQDQKTQLDRIQNQLKKCEQEKRALNDKVDELTEELTEKMRLLDKSNQVIAALQQENGLLREGMDDFASKKAHQWASRLMKILPKLSALAGYEPQAIIGLSPESVMEIFLQEASDMLGKIYPFPETHELENDLDSGSLILRVMLDDQNWEKLPKMYDWGTESPLEDYHPGQELRFRLLRRGWRTKNEILVRAEVTTWFEVNPSA